jgi:rubrerythrin
LSRIPRVQEHLKAGFTAEAASAARFRANAAAASRNGLPNLAAHWSDLARAKDELAVLQLAATGSVRGSVEDLEAALAEERYEIEVLYPRLIAAAGDEAGPFREVVALQERHLSRLESLRGALIASRGDVPAPPPAAPQPAAPQPAAPVAAAR